MSSNASNLIAIVFSDEHSALDGVRALYDLEKRGGLEIRTLHALKKEPNGNLTPLRSDDDFPPPSGTLAGLAIGGILGLLGAGAAAAVSAGAGAIVGLLRDLYVSESHADFLAEVAAALVPGKYAILAEVEQISKSVDEQMRLLGGVVFHTTRRSVIRVHRAQRISEFKAELNRLIAQLARSEGATAEEIQQGIDRARALLKRKLQSSEVPSARVAKKRKTRPASLQLTADQQRRDASESTADLPADQCRGGDPDP